MSEKPKPPNQEDEQRAERHTLRRRAAIMAGVGIFALSGLVARFTGDSASNQTDTEPQRVLDPPVTLENTPELEQAREQAGDTARTFAQRILDLHEQNPALQTDFDTRSDNMVDVAVYQNAAGGGSYVLRAVMAVNADSTPNPEQTQHIQLSMVSDTSPNPETSYSFSLDNRSNVIPGQQDWVLTTNGGTEHDYSTLGSELSGVEGELTPDVLHEATEQANQVFEMAAAGEQVQHIG